MSATLNTDYVGDELHGRIDEAPGLIARIVPDELCQTAPYRDCWPHAEIVGPRSYGGDGLTPDAEWPLEIECPVCAGEGWVDGTGERTAPDCPRCDATGECLPATAEEYRSYHGVAAALPVDLGSRYYPVSITDPEDCGAWNPEDCGAWIVWPKSAETGWTDGEGVRHEHSLAAMENILRGAIEETAKWMEGEVYGIIIEADPEADDPGAIPPNAMDSCWGFIGQEYAEAEATRMLADCYEAVERETAERRHWAERDVETVG